MKPKHTVRNGKKVHIALQKMIKNKLQNHTKFTTVVKSAIFELL